MYTVFKSYLSAGRYILADAMERIDYHVARGTITAEEALELTAIAKSRAVEEPETVLEELQRKINPLLELVRTETVLSDKLGYNWVNTYVGDLLVKQEYVLAYGAEGTADNPIPWGIEVELEPNHFYTYEGVRKVWVGESGVCADWDDPGWEVM